jgi:nucleotide-binding universal stress UspA family protein
MKILVPIDFTPVTENALQFALGLAETLGAEGIVLFHVVAAEKDAPPAEENLHRMAARFRDKTRAQLECKVLAGHIFDRIGKAAAALACSLIVMGTHGIKGMQRLVGSRAMKVITQSETPYIVVQHKPYRPIRKILVPVDYTREVKQLLPLLQSLNRRFQAAILLARQESKDAFIEDKIRNNLGYFKSFFDENKVPYTLAGTYLAGSKYKDVMAEADRAGADLLVATIDPETNITDYIMGVEEQKLVANESQIPVLCVNIRHFMMRKGGIFELVA